MYAQVFEIIRNILHMDFGSYFSNWVKFLFSRICVYTYIRIISK